MPPPQVGYHLVEGDTLCCDTINADPGGGQSAVVYLLIPQLHPLPGLLHQRWVGDDEGYDICSGHLHLLPSVRLDTWPDLAPQALEEPLVLNVI